MRRVSIVGVGVGDPEQLTAQAVRVLREADVILVATKPDAARELVWFRRELCERHLPGRDVRIVELADPPRRRAVSDHREAVEDWRRRRVEAWADRIRDAVGPDGRAAFLAWGDPSLYDSTLDVLERIGAGAGGAMPLEIDVIPGISSIHALTARHRIPLNRVGGAVQVTTGRRLRSGWPDGVDDVVVMLDADCSFRHLAPDGIDIYWGAYLGSPDELLVAGPLGEVADEIVRRRREARERKGWIMDTYLLRKTEDGHVIADQ